MIVFRESPDSGYKERTVENASADATIAFAVDFNTAGERLTKKSVEDQGKIYFPVDISSIAYYSLMYYPIAKSFNLHKVQVLNIAGNGLYTLMKRDSTFTQSQLDHYVLEFLTRLFKHLDNKIEVIRTGGQTGIDEAGAKAGIKLGTDTLVYAPKGWKFRGVDGIDISDEKLFKERFDI